MDEFLTNKHEKQRSRLATEGNAVDEDMGNLNLAQILDTPTIQSLINNFYNLTHIPMSIIDNEGNVLVGIGWQDICTQFHRVHPETCKNCIESDTVLTASISKGEFKLYKCKNNMWDIATPLIIGGKHLGNLFSGQFFFEDEQPDYEIFRKQAQKYGFDEEKYIKALDAAPRLSRETVNEGMAFFIKLADIISQISYNNINLAKSLDKSEKLMISLTESEGKYRNLVDNLEKQVKERTEELKNERDNFLNIIDSTLNGVFILNQNYELEYVNPTIEDDFGIFKPQKCYEYFYGNKELCLECKLRDSFEGKTIKNEIYSPKTGKTYDALSTLLNNIDGSHSVLTIMNDVTEHKNVQKENEDLINELKRSNDELQQFAYVTSHDLQEPLRTIASFTQLLERRYKGKLDSDADEFINYIINASMRMQKLIKDLLEYSKVTSKGEEFKLTNTNKIVKIITSDFQLIVKENNAEITCDYLPDVWADERLLTLVFQNIIGNAIKYKKPEEPPKIHISARKEREKFVFSVRDNGIGVETQYYDRIFMIFQRLHTREEYKGTGIGLAIVKKIIERHGGRIWLESELGVGSTFYFTIPIKNE